MAVKVYRPAYQVTLTKLVQRSGEGVAERYSGANRTTDLTPFLSEGGAVKVVKGIGEPAGAFTIAFADQPDPSILDSLYARIEPMDMIEIRGSREPHKTAGQPLPLLMRGFVSSVRRSEAIGAEGTPQRFVTVMGQDSGKLFLIQRLFPEAIYAQASAPYLDVYRLQAATGIEAAFLPVAEAMKQLVERVLNPKIAQMAAYADRAVPALRYRGSVRQGIVSPNLIAPFQGPYWGLVQLMADAPWNEAFVEDEEQGPVLIFRPTPFKDIRGAFIVPGAADPGTIELDASQVVSLDVARSDERIANFFFVPPGASMLDSQAAITISSIASGQPFDTAYGNNKPELYGLRKMVAESSLLPESIGSLPSQLPAAEAQRASSDIVQWHIERANLLRDMNRDNSVLEEGSATVQGSEKIKPGRFLRLTRGDLVAEAYVPRVTHNISPLDGWTSSISLARGMGFLERLRMTGSPFWKEGRRGPYSA
jgi:hypothetical protein